MIRILIALLIIFVLLFGAWLYLRYVYFFRDPKRIPEAAKGAIISPCDGRVLYIRRVEAGKVVSSKLGENIPIQEITRKNTGVNEGWLIGIYMSPLDVHFNYAPVNGIVEEIYYSPAKMNLPMVDLWEYIRLVWVGKAVNLFTKKFHFENERNTIIINDGKRKIVLVEIADKFVNKIDCFLKVGDGVAIGQKIAFIRRGSQVDMFIGDARAQPAVEEGEHVLGGQTVVFKLPSI